jgi:spore coat protein U-like protein
MRAHSPAIVKLYQSRQNIVQGTGTGGDQEIPVYGKIDAGRNVRTGLYEYTVLVTLSY